MQPAGSLRLPRQANRRDDLVLHRASARPVLGRRTAGRSAFRQRSRLGRMEVMFLLCRKCGTLGDAVECSHFESIVMISATALVVIACSILFFCTSVATASNFTPVKSGALRCSGVALRRRLLATSPLILERRPHRPIPRLWTTPIFKEGLPAEICNWRNGVHRYGIHCYPPSLSAGI